MRTKSGNAVWQAILLALIAAGVMLISFRPVLRGILGRNEYGPEQAMGSYRLDILWPNYFENGFIRRGLGGTIMEIVRWSGVSPAGGFHAINTVMLLIPLLLLLRRLAARGEPSWPWFAAFLILSPQLFQDWALDFGRSDMLTMSFVAWGAVAMVHQRHLLAVVALLAGSLVHEVALFYGAPLVAVLGWRDHRQGLLPARAVLAPATLLLGGLMLMAVAQRLFGDSGPQVARTILAHDPVDGALAAYMTGGGVRTLITSACMSFSEEGVSLYIASCFLLVMLNLLLLLLPRDRWRLAGLAFVSLLPMAVMSIIAIDYERWMIFAVMNAWIAAVALRMRDPVTPIPWPQLLAAAAMLLVLMPMRGFNARHPNPVTRMLVGWAPAPAGSGRKSFMECDPDWRSAIGLQGEVQPAR